MRKLRHLQRVEALLLDGLDLADDVVVDPEDGDGHLGPPLVPHRRHAALDADQAGPPRLRAHGPRTRLNDPAPALAAAAAGIVVVEVRDEGLRGEEAARGEARPGEGEVAEAREEASRGGRHGGGAAAAAALVVRLEMGRAGRDGWGVYAAVRWG